MIGRIAAVMAVSVVTLAVWARRKVHHFNRPPDPNAFPVSLHPVPDQDSTGARVESVQGSHGVNLYVRIWATSHSPQKGCILMMHGITWHSAYFKAAAEYMNRLGYTVVSFDHPGHGLSGSTHGVRAYHPDTAGYLDNIELMVGHASSAVPQGTPLFAYGESLGGALLLKALATRPALSKMLTGAIASGAPVGLPDGLPPKPVLSLLMHLSSIMPLAPMPPDKTTQRDSWVGAFGDQQLASAAYDTDPLVIKGLPLGASAVILPLLAGLPDEVAAITVPLLVLHGKDDGRVPWQQAVTLHAQLGSADKQLLLYDGVRHQLMQESAAHQAKIWKDLSSWLQARS